MALATRLAAREVRKRKGRTILVSILVALPLTAILLVSTWINTTTPTQAEYFKRAYGNADLVLRGYSNLTSSDKTEARDILKTTFGTDVQIDEFVEWRRPFLVESSSVQEKNKGVYVRLEIHNNRNRIRESMHSLVQGRWSNSAHDVAVTRSLAAKWNVTVGDTVKLLMPELTLNVTGIVKPLYQLNDDAMFVSEDSILRSQSTDEEYLLIDSPIKPSIGDLASLRHEVIQLKDGDPLKLMMDSAINVDSFGQSNSGTSLWIGVLTVLAFAVMSVVVSAAFATSARRQLTTIGQLSANGASNTLVQRSLALQGFWSGICGVGMSLIVVTITLLVGREYLEELAGFVFDPIRLPIREGIFAILIGLVSSTFAAWLPSRIAAQTSVLDALAGRRGEHPPRRTLLPLGLVLFASGVGLELLVAVGLKNSDGSAGSVFVIAGCVGGLILLAGICCLGPVMVSMFGWIGQRSRGVTRLTARGLFRNRSRSAAVVTSVTAFTALGIAVAMGAAADATLQEDQWLPNNMVMLSSSRCAPNWSGVPLQCSPVRAKRSFEKGVMEVIDKGHQVTQVSLSYAQARDINADFFQKDASGLQGELHSQKIVIANDFLLNLLDLSVRDRKRLDTVGLAVVYDEEARKLFGGFPSNEVNEKTTSLIVPYVLGVRNYPVALIQDEASSWGSFRLLITEKRAKEIGFEIFPDAGRLYVAKDRLTDSQRIQLAFLRQISFEEDLAEKSPEALTYAMGVEMTYASDIQPISEQSISAIVAIVLLVLVLLIVAIGLSLMAAEGKDERDVLLAVGAAPSTLSRLAGLRAFWLSAMGLLISVPAAVIPMAVVIKASSSTESNRVHIPWLLFALLLVVPIVAYVVARLSSVIAQIAKPIHISNAQFE